MDLNGESSAHCHVLAIERMCVVLILSLRSKWLMILVVSSDRSQEALQRHFPARFTLFLRTSQFKSHTIMCGAAGEKWLAKVEWQPLSVSFEISNERLQTTKKKHFNFTLNRVLSLLDLLKMRTYFSRKMIDDRLKQPHYLSVVFFSSATMMSNDSHPFSAQ